VTREIVIQKLFGFILVGAAIAYLTPLQIGLCFSVFGQGHFLGAYYYQWKAGKMKMKWVIVYAVLTIALFYWAVALHQYAYIALSAAVLFFIHHFQDEVTLFRKERSLMRTLEQLPPIILFSSLAGDALLRSDFTLAASLFSIAVFILYVILSVIRRESPDVLGVYYWLITAGLLSLFFFHVHPAPETLMGSVVLFHYVCWYVFFYFRFASNPAKQLVYIRDMFAVHGVVFGTYVLWIAGPVATQIAFGYIYLPVYFYIWAILHILFSVRIADYKAALRW